MKARRFFYYLFVIVAAVMGILAISVFATADRIEYMNTVSACGLTGITFALLAIATRPK